MGASDLQDVAPPRLVDGGQVAWGRYRAPVPDPALPDVPRWRLKEWHYTSVVTDELLLAFAVVQLGYVANGFCYVVDRRQPAILREWSALSPLGRCLQMAPSSVRGSTLWQRQGERLEVAWRDGGWHVELDLPLAGERLQGRLQLEPVEALALVHPLGPARQVAYTHKAAALPTQGELTLGGRRFDLQGLGTVDWTRAHALRTTRWRWASFAWRAPDGTAVGLNLSAEVYDDADGASRENGLWLDGRVHALGPVAFELPADPLRQPWRLRSRDGDEVELAFQPLGAREQHLHFGLLTSDFVQPYGEFHGTLRVAGRAIAIERACGVVERHLSVW